MYQYRSKIFFATYPHTADTYFNQFVENNPHIEILEFRYREGKKGSHSICILYRERKKEVMKRD